MTDIEITIKMQAIASVFAEYLAYYEPIYIQHTKEQAEKKPRHLRRQYEAGAIKDMQVVKGIVNRFSQHLNSTHEAEHDECIDLLHNALENIKIIENEST